MTVPIAHAMQIKKNIALHVQHVAVASCLVEALVEGGTWEYKQGTDIKEEREVKVTKTANGRCSSPKYKIDAL